MFRPLRSSEKLRHDDAAPKVTLGGSMSYAEAKQIALLRLELRSCWERHDRDAAGAALARFVNVVGNDNELAAEARRWKFKLAM
jgi:hypothetical protein